MPPRAQISAAYHQLLSRGWTSEAAIRELRAAIASQGDYMMHDKNGNVIIDGRSLEMNTDEFPITDEISEILRRDLEAKRNENEKRDRKIELELSEEGIREKPPHDRDKAPTWTEVRGMTSFYYICPRCGAMVPGTSTGPQLIGPDGIERLPKEHHENWHKSQLIDWFDDE